MWITEKELQMLGEYVKVLLIGSGAREHAMAWKLSRSPLLEKLFIWPGNPALEKEGEILDLSADSSFELLSKKIKEHSIDLVVCGPEGPLDEGLADYLKTEGVPTFGPVEAGARLESSKAFAKEIMQKSSIPTSKFELASDAEECRTKALEVLNAEGGVVLKASGLAAGKGVFVCKTKEQVEEGISRLYTTGMKTAAETVVIEELMVGRESSYFTFVGSGNSFSIGMAVDFKRLQDGDLGPNTGGMGCYTPVPWLSPEKEIEVEQKVLAPLLKTLQHEGIDYCGCLYVGLMWTESGPKVVEFNVRLGDPEAQILAVRDDRDWLVLMASCLGLDVSQEELASSQRAIANEDKVVGVVMASAGYPYGGVKPSSLALSAELFENKSNDAFVFGASVKQGENELETGSGRVMTVVGRADTFHKAREIAYAGVAQLDKNWQGCQWRNDIAKSVSE